MKKWQVFLDDTRQLKDSLGMYVDEGIVETVAIMRLLGFDTILSCEGHKDRDTGGPYVMFTSQNAKAAAQKWQEVPDKSSIEAKDLQKRAVAENTREGHRLYRLLEEYYENHSANYSTILTVRAIGLFTNRLEVSSLQYIQYYEEKISNKLLKESQLEMRGFTEFLKGKGARL